MPSVTIDTCVLAAPPSSADRLAIIEYVETLLDWKKLLSEPWVAIYMNEKSAEAMIESGVYPLRQALRRLFSEKGILEYDANTVCLLVDELLRLTPSFETYFALKDILITDVATAPNLLGVHTDIRLSTELARSLVLIAILRSHCRKPITDHNLVVKPWAGTTLVQVQALVHDVEFYRDDMNPLPKPPEIYQGDVLVCQNFRELILNLDELAIWRSAEDVIGLELATKIAVYKSRIHQGQEPNWDEITGFRFGCEFYAYQVSSCQANPENFVDRLLRSLVETIDNQNLADVHALRTSNSGNAPQRMRGQDKAWRRDIDREYHLHYWGCSDGMIEFATVAVHNMFEIPECL